MKKEVMEIWVAGLRSGEYQQGKEYLNYNNTSFCCLGVLCEIAIKNGVITEKVYTSFGTYSYDGSVSCLSYNVKSWAGIHSVLGYISNTDDALFKMNDSGDYSFEQIADFIEKNYEYL